MFGHLFNVLGRALAGIPNALASNWLGLVGFPLLVALISSVRTLIQSGWKRVENEWRTSGLVAVVAFLIAITCIFLGTLTNTIYLDHSALNHRILTLRHLVDSAEDTRTRELREQKATMDDRFNDLKDQCSELRGAKGQLDKRVQDQEGTINNCQEHAIQLLTPEPEKITVLTLDTSTTGQEHDDDFLLITNKAVTPVRIVGSCNVHLREASASPVGIGAFTGGLELQDLALPQNQNQFRYGQTRPPNTYTITFGNPAWAPTTPIRVHVSYTSYNQAICTFIVR